MLLLHGLYDKFCVWQGGTSEIKLNTLDSRQYMNSKHKVIETSTYICGDWYK